MVILMKLHNKEYNVDELVSKQEETSFLKNYGNGILLSKKHIDILNNYDIDYRKYNNISSLIFDIEEYLNDSYEEVKQEEAQFLYDITSEVPESYKTAAAKNELPTKEGSRGCIFGADGVQLIQLIDFGSSKGQGDKGLS